MLELTFVTKRGTPGPREEMGVIDPDGHTLIVARIDP